MFTRPTSGFSNLTGDALLEKHEKKEKQIYEKKKQEIQNYVLKFFKKMSWEFEAKNLSHSIRSKLESRVTQQGFSFTYKDAEYCPGGMSEYGGFTEPQIIISLPETPIENDDEDNGYLSDGWNPKFRASEIKNKIQEKLNSEYKNLTARIQAVMLNDPGYNKYTLQPKSTSPIVMEWIKESLNERGLIMKHVNESCPGDISGSYTEYTNYWEIINPKVKNYQSREIYL